MLELFKIYRLTKDASIRIPYKVYDHISVKGNVRPNAVCLTWAYKSYWTETAQDITWLKPSNEKLDGHASQELIKYLFESFSPNKF